jgi:tellurite resistance protein
VTFDVKLRTALQAIHSKPAAGEARAIIDVARLAAAADKKTDLSEAVVLLSITRMVCEMAGLTEVPTATAVDAARLTEIANTLSSTGARELAYASAYFVMVSDLDLVKAENQVARSIAEALSLTAGRAQELSSQMEQLVRDARG